MNVMWCAPCMLRIRNEGKSFLDERPGRALTQVAQTPMCLDCAADALKLLGLKEVGK